MVAAELSSACRVVRGFGCPDELIILNYRARRYRTLWPLGAMAADTRAPEGRSRGVMNPLKVCAATPGDTYACENPL